MFDLTAILTKLDCMQIHVFTWRKGVLVGTDGTGNRYYKTRRVRPGYRERRWVLYNGEFEATKVPPEWYGWLHHLDAEPLTEKSSTNKPWLKPHESNLTGTAAAYRPPGHPLKGGQRPKVSADYEPWVPG
ncbi:MAG: NADH:ubiquinone oxidoreductase subunit NDUFA12 [Rhodospirillaceae bacterium]